MQNLTLFFSEHQFFEYCFRIILSLIFGSLLGYERKVRKQIVGLRTLVIICVSCSLMSILSAEMARDSISAGDPTRIAAGVITGIGFIGGGVIMKQGLNIKGLTTAAIIFGTAGIGLTCGAGLYYISIFTFVIIILSLIIMQKFEHRIFPIERTKLLRIKFSGSAIDKDEIEKILDSNKFFVSDLDIQYEVELNQILLTYTVRVPHGSNPVELTKDFTKLPNLISVDLGQE